MANETIMLEDVPLFFTKIIADRPIVLTDNNEPASAGQIEGMEESGATEAEIEQAKDGVVIGWEITGRTEDKKVARNWKEQLGSKAVRAVREDKDDDESPIKYWQIRLRKKKFNAKGKKVEPVGVQRGDTLEALDPSIIGNGSVADVRVYKYDYSFSKGGSLIEGTASVLMGLLITKLVKYEPKERQDFEKKSFTIVDEDGDELDKRGKKSSVDEDDADDDKGSKKNNKRKPVDLDDDEIPF